MAARHGLPSLRLVVSKPRSGDIRCREAGSLRTGPTRLTKPHPPLQPEDTVKNIPLLIRMAALAALSLLMACQPHSNPAADANNQQYLQQHTKQEGIVSLPSGLQYKVLASGNGSSPAASDSVTVNYRGSLLDGTEFDSSYKRGEPATFPVNGVIRGWTEALQLMHEGDKWELTIPPQLGYGSGGAGSAIPGDAVLVFEVELLKVNQPG